MYLSAELRARLPPLRTMPQPLSSSVAASLLTFIFMFSELYVLEFASVHRLRLEA